MPFPPLAHETESSVKAPVCLAIFLAAASCLAAAEPALELFESRAIASNEDGATAAPRAETLRAILEDRAQSLALRLPGLTAEAAFSETQRFPAEGVVWIGRTAGATSPNVFLSLADGALSGGIRVDDRFFRLRPAGAGGVRIEEVTKTPRWYFGDDAVPAPPVAAVGPEKEASGPIPVAQGGVSEITILVAYTANGLQAAGGPAGGTSLAQLGVATANSGFSQSGVAARLSLAGVVQIDAGGGESASTAFLSRMTTSTPELGALRDAYGADLVSVWINGPAANGGVVGTAWILKGQGSGFAPYAYSIVETNWVDGPGYAFAHEVGHNLGCDHDLNNTNSTGQFPFSRGYQDPQGGFFHGDGLPEWLPGLLGCQSLVESEPDDQRATCRHGRPGRQRPHHQPDPNDRRGLEERRRPAARAGTGTRARTRS